MAQKLMMACKTCGRPIPYSSWRLECYSCYKTHKARPSRYNPCAGCAGEDCACCSYGRGY